MTQDKGNRAKVMGRWLNIEKEYRNRQTPRRPFKGEAQFTLDDLYFIYERELNCSPSQRRSELRQPGDLDRYKIVEPPRV